MSQRPPILPLVLLGLILLTGATLRDYLRVYNAHTEDLFIYRGFQTALIMRGTLVTEPFRRAMAQERQRLLQPTDEDHESWKRELLEQGERYHEVVFSADSPLRQGRTFGEDDEGWRLRLEVDGEIRELVHLERVRRPNSLQRSLYPHYNRWSDLWVARFERSTEQPRVIELHVASGHGNGVLKWSLAGLP